MRKAVLLASLGVALVSATSARVRHFERQVSDYELREACVRWFIPSFNENGNRVSNAKWRGILESQDPLILLDRLEGIRRQRVHDVEYGAISFVLAYYGREPALNTARMLRPMGNYSRELLPPNVYTSNDPGSPTAFGYDEINAGAYDSTAQLYRKQRRPHVLKAILEFDGDGGNAYFRYYIARTLFLQYPSDLLQHVQQTDSANVLGHMLAVENPQPGRIMSTLAVMAKDKRPGFRESARAVRSAFEKHLRVR